MRKKGQPDWVRISFTGHNTQTRRTDVSGYTQFVFDVPQGSIKLKLQVPVMYSVPLRTLIECFMSDER